MRRPRRVRQPGRALLFGQVQQRLQRPGRVVHARRGVADRREPGGHGVDGELLGPAAGHLVPGQRGGHAGVRSGPDRVGGGHRAVLGVLVVVHEHAVPLFLPPPGRGDLRGPPLDLPGHRHRRGPDLVERPARLDPGVDVHAAGPGRLGPAGQPEVGQHLAGDQRDVEDLRPLHPGHRVQVDPQLVRVVDVIGPDRVRVQVDAAQVGHPGQPGRVAQHDLVGGPPGRERQLHGLHPVRPRRRRPLLEERLLIGPVDEPLERHRPSARAAQRALGHGQVVPDQVQLGVPGAREIDLLRVADRDLAARDLDDLLGVRHVTTIDGALLPASLPCPPEVAGQADAGEEGGGLHLGFCGGSRGSDGRRTSRWRAATARSGRGPHRGPCRSARATR